MTAPKTGPEWTPELQDAHDTHVRETMLAEARGWDSCFIHQGREPEDCAACARDVLDSEVRRLTAHPPGCACSDTEEGCPGYYANPAFDAVVKALEELAARCDGPQGILMDGSNIDTAQASAALALAETVRGTNG